MNKDLKWLAENLDQWPSSGEDVALVGDSGVICFEYSGRLEDLCYPVAYRFAISRDQWQAARDELAAQKQWCGPEDGLPPVGAVCEVNTNFYGNNPSWGWCKFIGIEGGKVFWFYKDSDGVVNVAWDTIEKTHPSRFRPIRTEEDKVIEEMMQIKTKCGATILHVSQARELYRAGLRFKQDNPK